MFLLKHTNITLAIILALYLVTANAEQAPIFITSGQFETDHIDTTADIITVKPEAIKTSGAKELGELLQGQAGIEIRNAATGDTAHAVIDMRGFGATAGSNTLILINGRRLNNSSDLAPPDLSEIDLDDIEKIEIIQGSAGTIFGNQAVGGVINIITRPTNKSGWQIKTGIGSFDAYEIKAQIAGQTNIGPSYKAKVRKRENQQDREHSHARREHASLYLDQQYNSGRIFFEQHAQREHMQLPGSLFKDELATDRHQVATAYQEDFSNSETIISRLGLRQNIGSGWLVAADLNYRDNDGSFRLSGRSWPGSISSQTRQVIDFSPRISGLLPITWANLNFTLGAEIENTEYKLHTAFGPQEETQDNYSLYSQLAMTWGQNWTVNMGIRYAQISNNINNNTNITNHDDALTIGSLGLIYEPQPGWRLFTRWDQNYRFATVDEHTNVINFNNQPVNLKNQTGDSYELGFSYQRNGIELQITGYELDLNNEISFDSSTFFNINLAHTKRQGTVIKLNWQPEPLWQLGANYTYTDSSISSGPFAGSKLPLVPTHSGNIFIQHHTKHNIDLQLAGNLVGERNLGGDFSNTFKSLPGYGVINATLSYQAKAWNLTARIDNMLDNKYNETGAVGYDATGSLRDAYFPAAGRVFWFTMSYEP